MSSMKPLGSLLVTTTLALGTHHASAQQIQEILLDGPVASKCRFKTNESTPEIEALKRTCEYILSPSPRPLTKEEFDGKLQREMDARRAAINLMAYSFLKDISPFGVQIDRNNGVVFSENKEYKNEIVRNPAKLGVSNIRYKVSGNVLGTLSGDSKGKHLELKLIADFNL